MNHLKPEIIGVPQSNFTRAVLMVCKEKAIAYDHYPLPPHSPEVNAIHPLGKIPVLRHGDITLGESMAIVAYLDSLSPETPMGTASTRAQTGMIEQWVSIVMTAVDPIFIRQYAFAYLFPKTPDGSVNRTEVEAALPALTKMIDVINSALASKDFLAAERFTFADALLLSTLAPVQLYPEGKHAIRNAPNLSRYLLLHSSRASFVATDPSQWLSGASV